MVLMMVIVTRNSNDANHIVNCMTPSRLCRSMKVIVIVVGDGFAKS